MLHWWINQCLVRSSRFLSVAVLLCSSMWVSTCSKCVAPSLLSLVVSFIRRASLYCEAARLQLLVSTVVTVLGVVASQRRVATLSNCCWCVFHSTVHYVTSTLFFPCGLADQHKHLTHRHIIISHHVNKGAQWFKPDITCFKFTFQKLQIFLKNLKIKAGHLSSYSSNT